MVFAGQAGGGRTKHRLEPFVGSNRAEEEEEEEEVVSFARLFRSLDLLA